MLSPKNKSKKIKMVPPPPQSSDAELDRALDLVLRARRDPDVWENGVGPKFSKFAKEQPRGAALACLLSIL